ncbi:MAG: hypothetical protein Unbinned3338contig1000_53 [Prokaryotic dsDNA virus sp.]|nr:MAG: hypothetical protein Unbinned3338contig1000_53 [Prokaryotic dsDNA virus sp.]|tara:strand:+ start:12304 stop:12489 length:186 start_codon:yes stop_codon:yes gene_type:complete
MTVEERLAREQLINEVKLSIYNSIIGDSFERNNYEDMPVNDKMRVITLIHKLDKLPTKIVS